ncbi:putative benzoate 4-monooxygenase cytochrome P450 [Mollisia scopiformis]|uniref:Putative benzoate 4-monooxygenase cytochrome P450 n=1 Tax=Mollisia scopiformis TaxID=149040 RepID=A0A194X559_MOLSC|nr:putative benzoate 4-monooxygenase cytochrome P450 [Mollisia scopiformis]KUJ15316.1 putative benzoate 4-monooxygenase cytochrome P450 [Mollisia scopiformis]
MLAIVVIPALLILWIITSIRRHNKSGLKDIPNAHFSVPYSRLWLLSIRWRKKENRSRIYLHRRLGPVVRLAPRELSVNCVEDGIRTIYSAKFDKDADFYHALVDQTGFMVTMIGNDEHRRRRRMLAHPYSNSYITNSGTIDNILSRVKHRLQEGMAQWASTGASVDVYMQAKCSMLDVVTGFLFGSENATDTLLDPSFENDLTTLTQATTKNLHVRTSLEWPMSYFASWIGGNVRPDPVARSRWEEWLTQVITNSYRSHPTKPSSTASLYDHFYDNFKAADPEMSLNDMASFIAVECDDHLSASHIGLGILLSYTMYELSRAPHWQHALRKELGTLNEPSELSLAHRLPNLRVLDAVVTETMRTRAPCPGPFPRLVPESGCRLVGKFDVPGGTVVSSSAWALHFNPDPFPVPDEWRPQRWLEADEKTEVEMRKWIWTFGSGARVCIGTHFSARVMKELLITIYSNYETLLDEEFTESVEQEDVFSSSPLAGRIQLKFRRLTQPDTMVVA